MAIFNVVGLVCAHVSWPGVSRLATPLLAAKPAGVSGLAVAGMPLGSHGMEAPGYPADRYNVIAFGSGKTSIFAKH